MSIGWLEFIIFYVLKNGGREKRINHKNYVPEKSPITESYNERFRYFTNLKVYFGFELSMTPVTSQSTSVVPAKK